MNTTQADTSISRFLALGSLEILLNQALLTFSNASDRLQPLAGRVIEIHCNKPETQFFILVTDNGFEVFDGFSDTPDIQVIGPLGALAASILSPKQWSNLASRHIELLGCEDLIGEFSSLCADFSLAETTRAWLLEQVGIDKLKGLLTQHDPEWADQLVSLTNDIKQIQLTLTQHQDTHELMLAEIRSLRKDLQAERRSDLVQMTLGVSCIIGAILSATGNLPLLTAQQNQASIQTLLLAATGLTIVLSRLFISGRYQPAKTKNLLNSSDS